ncbi:POZ domain-containing protein [Daldinia caldariorum]|uniref:POZ domain-containing protein n=1 Tax=Daldinia caldariorum TaxID=326644 RepID=UPI002008BC78|nr:POZ domain-containing protein [Daldinia caldariorum]KAI1465845.1 POZ domain-containing protein [Daldinia caldariorum]
MSQDYPSSEAMLRESGESILESGMFSDVTVKCQDQVWKLHKSIICPRCPYFNKAFNGQFQEATTGELIVKDQKAIEVDLVIRYLYTGKISEFMVEILPSELFKAANFFQVNSLMKEIASIIGTKLNEMAARLRDMPQANTDLGEVFTSQEVEYLFEVIEISYGTTSASYKVLRDVVKDFIFKSVFQITKTDRFLAILGGIPELAVDIVKLLKHSTIVNDKPRGGGDDKHSRQPLIHSNSKA